MIDTCTWDNPGHDRYTGTVPAAIAAYGLPQATQSALIAAFERREFTDTVVIDRDAIRGQRHEYAPEIRAMHFGSGRRICGTVTRDGWEPSHVETALVVCAAGECIAWPAVCGNVFRLSQRPSADRPAQPDVVPRGVEPVVPPTVLANAVPLAEVTPEAERTFTGSMAVAAWAAAPWLSNPVSLTVVTPAVSEPLPWMLLALGLAGVAIARRSAR